MKEKDFALLFRHWLKANPRMTASFELKDTLGKDYLNFSEVTEAQINWALAINSSKGVLLRVQAVAEGMPDYIYLRHEPACIVIKYPNSFSIISISAFLLERERSKRKSLTEDRAEQISIRTVKTKTPKS